MARRPVYTVTFTIRPTETPDQVGLRIAELVALLKRDAKADVEVRIVRED